LGQGQQMPVASSLSSPITAASVGAGMGLVRWWETGEEMPGQARP